MNDHVLSELVSLLLGALIVAIIYCLGKKSDENKPGQLRNQDTPNTSINSPAPQTKSNPCGGHLPAPKKAEEIMIKAIKNQEQAYRIETVLKRALNNPCDYCVNKQPICEKEFCNRGLIKYNYYKITHEIVSALHDEDDA